MPTTTDTPLVLKPFVTHGINLTGLGIEATGDCPFCGREKKFSVSLKKENAGQWRCLLCGESGNVITFLRKFHVASFQSTTDESYEEFAAARTLLYPETLKAWGVCQSLITREWLVPGMGIDGQVRQLYRYVREFGKDRWRLYATPGESDSNPMVKHQIHMPVPVVEPGEKPAGLKKKVYICEGPWDAMALWEVLDTAELLGNASVIAVPGASVFHESWAKYFSGRRVIVLFDSDHPQPHRVTGALQKPVGQAGVERLMMALDGAGDDRPSDAWYINWGPEGYDPELKDGADVRDVLNGSTAGATYDTLTERAAALETLLGKAVQWDSGDKLPATANGRPVRGKKGNRVPKEGEVTSLPCSSWETLVNAWAEPLVWSPGLDRGLSVMLASVASTMTKGSQLWIKLMSPPSTAKTTFAEGLSVAKDYIFPISTFRGFHSGFRAYDGAEDNSLITKLYDKTLIIKDGDTLLEAPNRDQILAELRDVYDRVSRAHYRNGIHREHEGINLTVIFCGTAALRRLDSAELGARFLDCYLMDSIDDDYEDDVNWRVMNRMLYNMKAGTNGKTNGKTNGHPAGLSATESRDQPPEDNTMAYDDTKVLTAKRLTGGYVEYLRQNAPGLLSEVTMGEQMMRQCMQYAKFVAYLRTRPSKVQEEKVEREFSPRLSEQLGRLGMCVAAVLNKTEVDTEVINRVRQVAVDTAGGWVFNTVRQMFKAGADGIDAHPLALLTNVSDDKISGRLRFLRDIGVAEPFVRKSISGGVVVGGSKTKWRLTQQLRTLYLEAVR